MKFKNILLFVFLLLSFFMQAQLKGSISKENYDLINLEITVENLTIVLNKNGLIENFYSNEINGDVEYYDEDGYFEGFKKGKLKKIGNINLDYYDIWDKNEGNYNKYKKIGDLKIEYWETFDKSKQMKVKSIGNILIDYWDYSEKFGKIKSIGNILIDYGTLEIANQSRIGKVIKLGNVTIDYWDDKIFHKGNYGKIKSIKGNSKDVYVIIK